MMKLKTEKKYRLRNVVDYLGDKTKRIQIRKNLFWWTKYTQKKSNTLILKDGQKIHLKRWVQHEKDFLKAYLKKFDTEEVEVLRQVYQELSSRNPGIGIDKETFLQYFPLPGLWGERLFYRFDYKVS
jgi:predicted DNA-binding antitoxin AbrB/MazE fold protein